MYIDFLLNKFRILLSYFTLNILMKKQLKKKIFVSNELL